MYEGANDVRANQSTLHVGPNCIKDPLALQTRTDVLPHDCNVAENNNYNTGYAVNTDFSYGSAMNDVGGAVFAMVHELEGVFVFNWGVEKRRRARSVATRRRSIFPNGDLRRPLSLFTTAATRHTLTISNW